jgi:nucleotide-binding universal stress UspA family protein
MVPQAVSRSQFRGENMKIKDILVPVDFSPNSLDALNFALSLVEPDGEICLLHVLDADFIARVIEEGFSESEAATSKLRREAETRLQEWINGVAEPRPRLEPMVVIGKPFAEILRVAGDLYYSVIVMGKRGRRQGDIEEILFGSTAEKVLRATRIPVVFVPIGHPGLRTPA